MKKIILLVSVLLLLSTFAFAQLSAGFIAGISGNMFTGSGWDDMKESFEEGVGADVKESMLLGYSVGGFFTQKLTSAFSIQPEVLISKSGGKFTFEISADNGEGFYEITSTVLEITLLGAYSIPLSTGQLNFLAGPELMLILGESDYAMEYDGDSGSTSDTGSDEADDTTLYGLALGIDYDYPVGNNFIKLSARYARPFNSFIDDEDIFANKFCLSLGYGINL